MTVALALGACGEEPEPAFLPERTRSAERAPERDTRGAVEVPRQPPRAEPAPAGGIAAPDDVAAPPSDAERTASGLASKVLQPGAGARRPGPTDRVTVHYTGWRAADGRMFDSSVQRGEPSTFPLNGVIAGWQEGVQLMVEGEKRRFWIPANLAYEGRGGPQGMLVFDVELLRIL